MQTIRPNLLLLALSGVMIFSVGCSGGSADVTSSKSDSAASAENAAFKSVATDQATAAPASSAIAGVERTDGGAPSASAPAPAMLKLASLTVRAQNVESAERKAATVAAQYGGFVVASNGTNLASETPVVTTTVKIPQRQFAAAIAAFEGLGQRLEKSVQGEDVSGQIIDAAARIKTLSREEAGLNELLGSARKLDEMIMLRDRITQLRSEIEVLNAQRTNLSQRVAYSTLNLTLVQAAPLEMKASDPGWFNIAVSSAIQGAGEIYRGLAVLLINLFVFSPLWLPAGTLALWLSRRQRFKQSKPPVYP
jgi:hypothetical protein